MTHFLAKLGCILMPLGLICIMLGSIFTPQLAETSFGVEITPQNKYPFVYASGTRDGVLGLLGLLIVLFLLATTNHTNIRPLIFIGVLFYSQNQYLNTHKYCLNFIVFYY